MKEFFKQDNETILEKARELNEKNPFKLPTDSDFHYSDILIDSTHTLKIEQQADRAILYLHGGGMVLTATPTDTKLVKDIAKQTQKDVWAPSYPLMTETSIDVTFDVLLKIYEHMCQNYKHITVIGFSAGASLAMGLCLHLNALNNPLPMPDKLVVCSPGIAAYNQDVTDKMTQLNDQDILLDVNFLKNITSILTQNKTDIPSYMLAGIDGDFTNFPPTHLFYGEDEIVVAASDDIVNILKQHTTVTLDIEPKMFHCYMMFHIVPEGKKKWKEIISLLKNS